MLVTVHGSRGVRGQIRDSESGDCLANLPAHQWVNLIWSPDNASVIGHAITPDGSTLICEISDPFRTGSVISILEMPLDYHSRVEGIFHEANGDLLLVLDRQMDVSISSILILDARTGVERARYEYDRGEAVFLNSSSPPLQAKIVDASNDTERIIQYAPTKPSGFTEFPTVKGRVLQASESFVVTIDSDDPSSMLIQKLTDTGSSANVLTTLPTDANVFIAGAMVVSWHEQGEDQCDMAQISLESLDRKTFTVPLTTQIFASGNQLYLVGLGYAYKVSANFTTELIFDVRNRLKLFRFLSRIGIVCSFAAWWIIVGRVPAHFVVLDWSAMLLSGGLTLTILSPAAVTLEPYWWVAELSLLFAGINLWFVAGAYSGSWVERISQFLHISWLLPTLLWFATGSWTNGARLVDLVAVLLVWVVINSIFHLLRFYPKTRKSCIRQFTILHCLTLTTALILTWYVGLQLSDESSYMAVIFRSKSAAFYAWLVTFAATYQILMCLCFLLLNAERGWRIRVAWFCSIAAAILLTHSFFWRILPPRMFFGSTESLRLGRHYFAAGWSLLLVFVILDYVNRAHGGTVAGESQAAGQETL